MKNKQCRFCLQLSENVFNIFKQNKTFNQIYLNILIKHLWFEIKENDGNSEFICQICWSHIEQFHQFYLHIEEIHLINGDKQLLATTSTDDIVVVKTPEFIEIAVFDEEIIIKTEIDEISNLPLENTIENNQLNENYHIDIVNNDNSSCSINEKHQQFSKIINNKSDNDQKIINTNQINDDDDKLICDFFKIQCIKCKMEFFYFKQLQIHYRTVHQIKNGYILCCNKKLQRKFELLEHRKWHINPEAFKCQICQKMYHDQCGLKMHQRIAHGEQQKQYICDICGSGFSIKHNLLKHLRQRHSKEKNHKCLECGKSFALKAGLQNHIRGVHENAFKHICDICAKIFKGKEQCERHRKLQHFDESNQIVRVQCPRCGIWLKDDLNMKSHLKRTHEELPVNCKICGKISPNRWSLKYHMNYVHESERSHKCTMCDKAFKKAIALKEHLASHTGLNLYTCPYCPKKFNSNSNRHNHRKKAHPQEWLRDRRNAHPTSSQKQQHQTDIS